MIPTWSTPTAVYIFAVQCSTITNLNEMKPNTHNVCDLNTYRSTKKKNDFYHFNVITNLSILDASDLWHLHKYTSPSE